MSVSLDTRGDTFVVEGQLGRTPRSPWRVAHRCVYGHPSVIVSPPRLEDGTLFPTWAWLTCPYLVEEASARESAGWSERWLRRVERDPEAGAALRRADEQLRAARAAEGGGEDPCAGTGVAGQLGWKGPKCLHAHLALALLGIDDPIGADVAGETGEACDDERCSRLLDTETGET